MSRLSELIRLGHFKEVLDGSNSIIVSTKDTPTDNAAELQAAYNKAKTMSPSSENIVTVVVAPGVYTFGETAFTVDTPYINIVSLTGNADVLLDGINVTANNVYLKGLNCETNQFLIDDFDEVVCERCVGGEYSFAGDGGIASGTFIDCTGGDVSFGGTGTASGTFNNCTSGYASFGGGAGTASGIFNYCTGGDYSFGADGNTSGTFTNCTGGGYSFGGGEGGNGTVSGTFIDCTGGGGSFGGDGTISSTAKLYYCRVTSGTFGTPQAGGKLVLCIDGTDAIVTTA